ncbi:MAG: hypothetical protein NT091_03470 [Candidatus Falkowbacteria bacterium]|nr:hypothetical protein [Candidatus Falkowbacteria bacterium]
MAIFLTQHDRMNLISSLFGATVIYFTILFLLKGLHFIPIKEILRIKK